MSFTSYKIKNADGGIIDIKVVKEFNIENELDDDVLAQYLETLSQDEFENLKTKIKDKYKIFKVLVEDEKKIEERKENWYNRKGILDNCKESKDTRQCISDEMRKQKIEKLPQFNMDILIVDPQSIVDPASAPAAPAPAPAAPAATQGGTRRRRRNNKKSKRKPRNNRKKTNRHRR